LENDPEPNSESWCLIAYFYCNQCFFVALTQDTTREKIKYNEDQLLIKRLGELVSGYDNNILEDKFLKEIKLHGLQQKVGIYPAKQQGKTFAYLVEHTYPNGYNGNIRLLTGFDIKRQLLGVRVITHKETPGLGDKIETRKSDWIKQFSGLSLSNPNQNNWKVKRDGGVFDSFTGATITPRAIVSAAYQVLVYFTQHEIN
jgi:electron transport complex, RnfABCDGE type, G subunit